MVDYKALIESRLKRKGGVPEDSPPPADVIPSNDQNLQLGEIVWLKSGGPAMTIKKLGDELTCIWFSANHECHEASFAPVLLTKEKPVIQ